MPYQQYGGHLPMSPALICESFQRTTELFWIFPQGYRCKTTGHVRLGESSTLESLFSRKDIRDEPRPWLLSNPSDGRYAVSPVRFAIEDGEG